MALDPLEMIIIGVVVVVFLLLGPKKIPELARSIGMAKREFQQGSREGFAAAATAPQEIQTSPAGNELLNTARKLGIRTEGKTLVQISDEIVAKANPAH